MSAETDRIQNLEWELAEVKTERDELAATADRESRFDQRRKDALDMIGDIAHGILSGDALPTPELIRHEFAGWVERRVGDKATKPGQADALMAALDALDDIIAGRMRRVS